MLAVARLVQARRDREGFVADHASEAVFSVVARWCEGAATDAEVRHARRNVSARRPAPDDADDARHGLVHVAYHLAACVGGGRGVGRERSARCVVDGVQRCLQRLGEPEEVARSRIVMVFGMARRRPDDERCGRR